MTKEIRNPKPEIRMACHVTARASSSRPISNLESRISIFGLRISDFGFFLLSLSALADSPRPTLPPEQRTNGKQTLAVVEKAAQPVLACSARIESLLGRPVCAATVVGMDGYILTKASEVPDMEKVRLKLPDGRKAALREIHREVRFDLVLAQAVGLSGLRAANFGSTRLLAQGHWLCGSTGAENQTRIGIISANRRRIPGLGPALGIRMDEKAPKDVKGVRLVSIAAESPAEAAGLQADDILLAIADEAVEHMKQVHDLVKDRQPGEFIEVRYLREGKEASCRVRLASKTKIMQNWEGEDFANGGVSLRTDNFPDTLQHDIPLSPADMGGPLATLEGRVVGINIARVDRVTTLALPVESFWTEIQQWINADRHPPKAQAAE
jgi:S1-C subfamily serine protease